MHDFQEAMSERQVNLYNPSVMSMVVMVQNGRKYIKYLYRIIKQLLTCFGGHEVLLTSNLNHIDLCFVSVNMRLTVQ